jgi:uncharacterized protein (DUF433 family)
MVVLDPMAGSGTTLIAAQNLGRRGLGFDRDPLALLVARSALQIFELDRLKDLCDRILVRARKWAGCVRLPQICELLPDEDRAFIQYWFPPQSQRQLFALSQSIRAEPEGAEQDLAWVIFSSLIIAKSAGASYALDLPRSRPHRRLDKPVRAKKHRRTKMSWEELLKRIMANPEIFSGRPIIRGMRISVELISACSRRKKRQSMAGYPELEPDNIRARLAYAHAIIARDSINAMQVSGNRDSRIDGGDPDKKRRNRDAKKQKRIARQTPDRRFVRASGFCRAGICDPAGARILRNSGQPCGKPLPHAAESVHWRVYPRI